MRICYFARGGSAAILRWMHYWCCLITTTQICIQKMGYLGHISSWLSGCTEPQIYQPYAHPLSRLRSHCWYASVAEEEALSRFTLGHAQYSLNICSLKCNVLYSLWCYSDLLYTKHLLWLFLTDCFSKTANNKQSLQNQVVNVELLLIREALSEIHPFASRIRTTTSMSASLYSACAEVLSLSQSTKDDLEALLHPETGFAPRLRQICEEQCVFPFSSMLSSCIWLVLQAGRTWRERSGK